MRRFWFLFLLIAIFNVHPALAQPEEIKAIDSLMNLFVKNRCFNGDMLITVNNRPFCERAVGYRSQQAKDQLAHNSLFNIGSISKPFTSVAILQLQEKKSLTIEDNVKKSREQNNPLLPTLVDTLQRLKSKKP